MTSTLQRRTKSKNIAPPALKKLVTISDKLEYKIITDADINLTEEEAVKFLELESFEGERAVRDRHVQFLYDEYNSGRFLWHNVILASAELEGKRYRINGQHTCWMRFGIPAKDAPKECIVRWMHYKVNTGEQLRALYCVFDRGAPRTPGHLSKVILLGGEAAHGIAPSYIPKLVSGYALWTEQSQSRRATQNVSEITAKIEKAHPELFSAVASFFVEHYDYGVIIRRNSVIASMFATFDRVVKPSLEFWGPVFTGIGFEQTDDPRYVLKNWLETHGHSSAYAGISKSAIVPVEGAHRLCINAWNHWRSGNKINALKLPSVDGPRPKVKN